MKNEKIVLGYVTARDLSEATLIANDLVNSQLAACVNLISGMKSIYRWEGKIETAEEVVIIVKTRAQLCTAVTERVKALHSYECPCVIFVPIESGNPEYLNWLVDNSSSKELEPKS